MTVKLPTKISLGHTDINIKLIESGVALEIGEQQGSYSYRTNTIYLDEERIEGAAGIDLVLHELGHAIFYQYKMQADEEHIVNSMATGYTEIFKRNPLLLQWVMKELGNNDRRKS